MTMVVVTHEMGFARTAANRVIFMADGAIVEENTPDEFFTNPRSERAKDFLSKILDALGVRPWSASSPGRAPPKKERSMRMKRSDGGRRRAAALSVGMAACGGDSDGEAGGLGCQGPHRQGAEPEEAGDRRQGLTSPGLGSG